MMIFLSKVETAFDIAGRGAVVVFSIEKWPAAFKVRMDDYVCLQMPDGEKKPVRVKGIESVSCSSGAPRRPAFIFEELAASQIPEKAEIWGYEEGERP